MTTSWELWQVDAFTDTRFHGNPAAICFLEDEMPDTWMQQVAAEMNLAETAFLLPDQSGWLLRWFTPAIEVELCGHATLAAAHSLWGSGRLDSRLPANFLTKSGLLTASLDQGWITLDFPATPAVPVSIPPEIATAFGTPIVQAARSRYDLLLEIESPAALRALTPDLAAIALIPARGVIITSPSDDPQYDFLSRWFGPQSGVAEDPVTGSAHCALAPWWSAKLHREVLTGYQASPRGGVVRTRLHRDRVLLSGQAVTVFTGDLLIS